MPSIRKWFTVHRLYRGWILCAGLAAIGIGMGAVFGVGWATVINGFLLGFALGNIGMVRQMIEKHAMMERLSRENDELLRMHIQEIAAHVGEQIRRMREGEPEEPRTLQ